MLGTPPSQSDLNAAFEAVWKAPAPVAIEAVQAGGHKEQLYASPALLAPLGDGRYALVVKESNPMLAHMDSGAVSVAYVARQAGGWRALGDWRELAWIGETGGGDVRVTVRRDLGPRPLLLAQANHLTQGDQEVSAAVVRLDADRPVTLGVLPLDGDNTGAGYPDQENFSYRARIVPERGGVLAVRYEGWTAPGLDKPQRRFRRTIAFRLKAGCLAPMGKLAIPGGDYEVSFGCAATSSP